MVSSVLVSLPITPAQKGNWNRLNLFIFQPNKFLCLPPSQRRWTRPLCQSTPLAGKDLQPAKKRENTDEVKIEKTAIQLPLGSRCCPHLLQPPIKIQDNLLLVLPEKYVRPIFANCYIPPLPLDWCWCCCW